MSGHPEYTQADWEIRCESGRRGVEVLAPDSDAVVLVDVLSFTTCVDIATARGAVVFPYRYRDETAANFAREHDALLAGRNELGLSLRPASLVDVPPGTRLVLPSPNGSTLSTLTGKIPTFAGCLRNARVVAAAAMSIGPRVSVIAAGEEWPDQSLRMAYEDACGAGAIIHHLRGRRSPEAEAAHAIFSEAEHDPHARIADCVSGREKQRQGFERDIELAAVLDVSRAAPFLDDGAYRA